MFQPLIEEVAYRDPPDALAAMPAGPGLVFLDSAMAHPELGRWSWLAVDPFGRFTSVGGRAGWNGEPLPGHPVEALRAKMRFFCAPNTAATSRFPSGGATGFFSYEAGRLFERLPPPKTRGSPPEIDLAFHDVGVLFDGLDRRCFIVSNGWPEPDAANRTSRARRRAGWMRELLQAPSKRRGAAMRIPRGAWRSNTSPERFKANVERTRRFIADGDIFQANLTQAWRAELPAGFDPITLYAQLREANPAPFGALLLTPERTVASTSPEGFLRLQGASVETRPIKGTARRSLADPAEDSRLAQALLASEKDRAENIMIVDLMRNDLSRVCRAGTVEAPVLCSLESYASVHHLVSVVRGELKPGLDALHLLAACFPGGSITGAPKIRAMEIINALEPEPRGVYCGSVVHLGFDGSLRSSIAIRTLVAENGVASIHAGGGITLLSDPDAEYAETLVKAERMFQAFDPGRQRAERAVDAA